MTEETAESTSQALVPLQEQPPAVLPAVMLDDLVPFPGSVAPVLIESQQRRDAVLHAKSNNGFLLLVNRTVRSDSQDPGAATFQQESEQVGDIEAVIDMGETSLGGEPPFEPERERDADDYVPTVLGEFARVGALARIIRVLRLPDNRSSALVQVLRRAQPIELLRREPFPIVRVLYPLEVQSEGKEVQATFRQLRMNLQAFFEAHPAVSGELKMAAMAVESPGILADFIGQHLSRDFDERAGFLAELDVARRLHRALEVTIRELDLLTVGNRISQEIKEKVEKHQRDYFLREQLKAIRTELGEEKDPAALAVEELREKLEAAGLPEAARARADEELKRLQLVPPESPEHNVVRSYLEWIASLPWSAVTEDGDDLNHAQKILDEDHYGLDEVKARIIEFLAVRSLNPNRVGTLLCFAGPPGVGKTSLGQSIARALGREFYRFSVGGMRDEAEIKGHRRTYIGAMPGRILQGLRQVKTRNPVFMLDELDKMSSDWRGDPSSAMLEVLDPAQNVAFLDHYLDLTFDLSRVMFIATANVRAEIPDPLRDRLEVIDLPGYIPPEKLEIARRYLFPRERKDHGLSARQLQMGPPVIRRIIAEYTHEAGVRELNRAIGKICRKRATELVRGQQKTARVGGDDLAAYLGPQKIHDDRLKEGPKPGVAVGLAWTPVGGDVLFIEAVTMQGKGQVKVTGHLGEVMSESAKLAVSYVRSRAQELGIAEDAFREQDIHLHFPAGAVRKDGPSAGVTVTTALISLLTRRAVRSRLAMTGEMTLRGDVLAVGGVREKVVAARRAGVTTVIVPERNRADVEEIPDEVRKNLRFVFATTYDDVLAAAFAGKGKVPRPNPKANKSSKRGRQAEALGPTTRVARAARQRLGQRRPKKARS